MDTSKNRRIGYATSCCLRSIQKRTGGFTEFVPLGFIHENTRLFRHGGARPGAKRDEHLRVHALARILLHGAIKNLQVSWVKLGFEASLACLQAGANDFSGTLMEESISKAAGATFGEYVAPEEFRARIRSIDESRPNAPPRTKSGACLKILKMIRGPRRRRSRWFEPRVTSPTPKAPTERFPCEHSSYPSRTCTTQKSV